MAVETQEQTGKRLSRRPTRIGTVESNRGEKTIKVRFDYTVKHPKYGKYCKRSTTLHTHDEKNEAGVGDVVEVVSCRRLSKTKCWRLVKIVRRSA